MTRMHAITVGDDRLKWTEVEKPTPGPGEVRIQVAASAVNRADLMQRRGLYPPPPGASELLGLECSGRVDALGEGVADWRPGDAVCALLSGGGYAEYALAPAGSLAPVPAGVELASAAALPEVFATAWLNLYMEAAMQPGELALIHAGGSGVGTAAVQLCRAFGNPVFVTVGEDDKLARCLELGAGAGHNRKSGGFAGAVKEFAAQTGRGRVDVILDPVGAAYLADNLSVLATDGRLVLIGLMGGREASFDLAQLLAKRFRIIGSTLRTRSPEAKAKVVSQLRERVWPRIGEGKIQPIIEASFPMQEAEAAQALVAGNGTFGKVLLTL